MYTGANGAVTTYTQPPESLGPITSVPYTARVPASSNCTPFESANVYTGLPEPTGVTTTTGGASRLSTSRTGTGSAGAAASTTTSGAKERMVVSGAAVVGVVLSALFFA